MSLTPEERNIRDKAIVGHAIALLLIIGFFVIVLLALTGTVKLSDPTISTFTGTVAGYVIGQLARPLAFYFQIDRPRDTPTNNDTKIT